MIGCNHPEATITKIERRTEVNERREGQIGWTMVSWSKDDMYEISCPVCGSDPVRVYVSNA